MPAMNGALIIDKPAGMTSHDVVARVRKMIGERRVGHTGTLDPFATGVLVVLVGRATRLAQFLSGADKEYEATIRLGYATDTGDMTGARILSEPPAVAGGPHAKAHSAQSLSKEKIEAAMASLCGEIEQTPPMYSAKKVGGRKLYELARKGEQVAREPVRVTIHCFELRPDDDYPLRTNDDGLADLAVRVGCSAGTYIRTLAEDLGKKLGVGAHLAELRRTRAGQFTIENALTLEELADQIASNSIDDALMSSHAAVTHLPAFELDDDQARRTINGIDLQVATEDARDWNDGEPVRLSKGGELIAVGKFDLDRNVIHPAVVLANG